MGNPFGDDVAGGNPFGDSPISSGNPFGDEAATAKPKSFMEHMGSLLSNTPMVGTIQPEMVPSNIGDQFSLGAAKTVNTLEAAYLQHPDNLAARESPEAQARIAQLKGDRGIADQLVKEAQANDGAVAKVVGDAVQSLPGSLASIVPVAAGAPMALAAGAGLGINFAMETADEFINRMDEYKQPVDEAWAAGLRHGAVATALETLPFTAGLKYMRGAAPLGKTLLRVGVGEGVQEGLTQAFDDVSTNLEGLTDHGVGDIASNAGRAAVVGMAMAPMMGPFAHAVRVGKEYGIRKEAEAAQAKFDADVAGLVKTLSEKLIAPTGEEVAPVYGEELTPYESAVASVQRAQLKQGLDVAPSEDGLNFGQELSRYDIAKAADEGGVSQAVAARRLADMPESYVPLAEKPFVVATEDRVLGLTPAQVGHLPAGFVGAVGELDGENFSAHTVKLVTDTVREFIREHAPQARVLFDLSILGENQFGSILPIPTGDHSTYVLNFMDMKNLNKHGVSDTKTSAAALGAIAHEVGHVVMFENFYSGLGKTLDAGNLLNLRHEISAGEVSPGTMAALQAASPVEAALVGEWQRLRKDILEGRMSAAEFLEQWTGLRKFSTSVLKGDAKKSLYDWAETRLGTKVEGRTALELIEAPLRKSGESQEQIQEFVQGYLSLDEFMAEHYSRAAYTSGKLAKTTMGQYFANTLESLRNLFRSLKSWRGESGERLIAPNTTFQEWLDALTQRYKGTRKPTGKWGRVPKHIAAAQKELAEKAGTPFPEKSEIFPSKGEEKEVAAPPEQVEVPVDVAASQVAPKEVLEKVLQDLLFSGTLHDKHPRYVAIRGMLKRGQLAEAQAKLEDTLGENLRFDREYTSKVASQLPKKEVVLVETVRGLLKNAAVRQKERNWFENWIEANATGDVLSRSVLMQDVENPNALEKLYPKDVTGEDTMLDQTGVWSLGYNAMDMPLRSTIWSSPQVEIPREVLYDQHKPYHWKEHNDYYAHSRGFDLGPVRVLVEVQNDNLSRYTAALDHTEITDWLRRILQEEMASAAEAGLKYMWLPTTLTATKVQGWQSATVVKELEGTTVYDALTDTPLIADGRVRWNLAEMQDGMLTVGVVNQDEWAVVNASEVSEELKKKLAATTLADLEDGKRPAQLYQKELPKMLRSLYGESVREVTDEKGNSWLQVPVVEAPVLRFDRENPYKPGVMGATLVDLAGAEQGREQDALASWKNLGTDSPMFKRWFGSSQVVDAEGKPLGVFRGYSTPRAYFATQPLFWFSDNPVEGAGVAREEGDPARSNVQRFYLQMENPLVLDQAGIWPSRDTLWKAVAHAKVLGHDGLVMLNANPLSGERWYLPFQPGQAAMDTDLGKVEVQNTLHWDQDSPNQQSAKGMVRMLGKYLTRGQAHAHNATVKAVDYVMQLQQIAASQPGDGPLQAFMGMIRSSLMMKNRLQYPAEETTKALLGASPETVRLLRKVMQAELMGGELQGLLVGLDEAGVVVWGGQHPSDPAGRRAVRDWRVQDGAKLRAFLSKQGVDVTTQQGQEILGLYLKVRNAFQVQFKGLEIALKDKAMRLYENAPLLLKQELYKVEELMSGLRGSPFVPQGRFGDYVLIVQKDQGSQGVGKRRFITVRRQHFESKAEFDEAYVEWQQRARGDASIRVKSRVLDDTTSSLPMQLPVEFLEKVAETGDFTDDQIEMLSELMTRAKYDKMEARYAKIQEKTEGQNEDFIRVFSAFALNNSNFVWKTYYRTAMNSAVAAERTEIRMLEKSQELEPKEQLKAIERKRRNIVAMERAMRYIMHPPQEFHNARLWLTMLYLAYNVKTAVMNVSTMINTWAAVTTEYGELKGEALFAKGLKDSADWLRVGGLLDKGKASPWQQEIAWLKAKAESEGVVDQSYAYFLAGQADAGGALGSVHTSKVGRATHMFTEVGMYPFRVVEKFNRVATLSVFYRAERESGATMEAAYGLAVQKMNLLQNAYDQANKPELLRGKKSILMMFASYTQFMGWVTSGGYERAARAQARALGRTPASVWHGTTMKIWLIYLLLGGLMGVPYGENILELVKFMWRRVFKQPEDMEIELRKMLKEMGLDANLAMHGLLHNAGGFDLAGSFGLGRLIPGVDLLNRDWRNPMEALGNGVLGFAGPAGGAYKNLTAALAEFAGGNWGEGLKKFPGETGALAKAIDAYLLQKDNPTYGVTAKNGERLTYDLKTGEFRDLTTKELMGMALGANPTLLSENREMRSMIQGEQIYWMTRRSDLMDKYWKGVRTQNEQMRDDVREEIDRFNETVPDFKLRITGKDIAQSMKTRRKAVRVGEAFGTSSKKMRGEADEVINTFKGGGD